MFLCNGFHCVFGLPWKCVGDKPRASILSSYYMSLYIPTCQTEWDTHLKHVGFRGWQLSQTGGSGRAVTAARTVIRCGKSCGVVQQLPGSWVRLPPVRGLWNTRLDPGNARASEGFRQRMRKGSTRDNRLRANAFQRDLALRRPPLLQFAQMKSQRYLRMRPTQAVAL